VYDGGGCWFGLLYLLVVNREIAAKDPFVWNAVKKIGSDYRYTMKLAVTKLLKKDIEELDGEEFEEKYVMKIAGKASSPVITDWCASELLRMQVLLGGYRRTKRAMRPGLKRCVGVDSWILGTMDFAIFNLVPEAKARKMSRVVEMYFQMQHFTPPDFFKAQGKLHHWMAMQRAVLMTGPQPCFWEATFIACKFYPKPLCIFY
jgi:hypothetical protein